MMKFRWALAGLAALAAGCAPAMVGSSPARIAQLEQQRTANPNSAPVLRSLGIAYFQADRLDEARSTLARAAELDSGDGLAALYLGLTAEKQNDLAAARQAYETYLRVGGTRRVKSQITARLAVIARKENQERARAAIARERELAATPGPVTTIAVVPFTFSGSDTSLRPLERGFAELVTTDLSRVSALRVVDRANLQAVLEEIARQQAGGVQEGTGVRAGRILQAGTIVGGTLSQVASDRLNATAIATNVASTAPMGAGASDQQPLDELFTLEKNLVLKLLTEDLKIVPTTAERNAIEQRPTRSLAAFLAYSRGLTLEDEGRFDEAGRAFDDALRLDPGFSAAQQKRTEASTLVNGANVSAATVQDGLRGTSEGSQVLVATQGAPAVTEPVHSSPTTTSIANGLNPSTAGSATIGAMTMSGPPSADASAGTGGDNPTTRTGTVTVIVRRP